MVVPGGGAPSYERGTPVATRGQKDDFELLKSTAWLQDLLRTNLIT